MQSEIVSLIRAFSWEKASEARSTPLLTLGFLEKFQGKGCCNAPCKRYGRIRLSFPREGPKHSSSVRWH